MARRKKKKSKNAEFVEAHADLTPEQRVSVDLELKKAEARFKEAERGQKAALDALQSAEARAEAWAQVSKPAAPIRIAPRRKRKAGSSEGVAVFVTSDWHIGERVDPATINGLNEYNPQIAEERIKAAFQNALTLIRKERYLVKIDHLVLAVIGDLITGHIHEELAETNWLHPVEEALLAKRLLTGGIEFLLDHGDFKKISIPCCYGNHGRTTRKRRVSNGAKSSYEWMMYHDVQQTFKNEPRVDMQISSGILQYSDILDTRIRFHHGDNIRYHGGIGGITVPLNKAMAQWNDEGDRPANYDVMAHYHQLQFTPKACVNGSIIGYNAYAQSIKARPEIPQQALFLVVPKYGPVCFNRVFCEP